MKTTIKKALSVLLALTVLTGLSLLSHAAVFSGSCGADLTWELDSDSGVLTISGTGAMTSYSSSSPAPWKPMADSIQSVIIGDGVTSIGNTAFSNCAALTGITCGSGVTTIGSSAFANCTALAQITLPDSLTSLGSTVFKGCESLAALEIPKNCTNLGLRIIEGCTALETLTVAAGNTAYESRDNCNGIIDIGQNELAFGCKTTVIPASVTSIGQSAFRGCVGLTELVIPEGVMVIWHSAFSDCVNLQSITLPQSVYAIQSWAFKNCSSLTSFTIPAGVRDLYSQLFDGCTALEYIHIEKRTSALDIESDTFPSQPSFLICTDDAVTKALNPFIAVICTHGQQTEEPPVEPQESVNMTQVVSVTDSETGTASDKSVTMEYVSNCFAEDQVSFDVAALPATKKPNSLFTVKSGDNEFALQYQIKAKDADGRDIQPVEGSAVTVLIPLENIERSYLREYNSYIIKHKKADGTKEDLTGTVVVVEGRRMISFQTASFSEFSVQVNKSVLSFFQRLVLWFRNLFYPLFHR